MKSKHLATPGILTFLFSCFSLLAPAVNENERPDLLPESLLELQRQMVALDREAALLIEEAEAARLELEMNSAPLSPWRRRSEINRLMRAHQAADQLRELDFKRRSLNERAWQIYRQNVLRAAPSIESGTAERRWMDRWMKENFSLPQDRPHPPDGPRPRPIERINQPPMWRGQIRQMEQRIEELERRVEEQEQEIRRLRQVLEELER